MTWVGVAMVLAVAAGTGASAGNPAPQPSGDGMSLPGSSLDSPPPPGSPEDQALWRAGLEVTNEVQAERSRATRLQLVLANLRYVDRLRAIETRGGEAGEKAKAIEKRVNDAHAAQFSVLTAQWPIDTFRVCGFPAMEFASMLSYGKTDPAELSRHRTLLTGCVEQTRAALKLMKQGNDALEDAMRAAETFLSRVEANPAKAPRAAESPDGR